jgi:hypothetical protein
LAFIGVHWRQFFLRDAMTDFRQGPQAGWTRVGGALLVTAALVCVACSSQGRSTVIRAADFDAATQEMVASLSASDFLRDRTPTSPPIIITIDKVENLTSDIIPPGEQWMLMARLQGALPVRELGRTKNIRFQIPPERRLLTQEGGYRGDFTDPAAETPPTHVMKALFRSSTRTGRTKSQGLVNDRLDYYTMQYVIESLQTREIVWTDSFEFKRQATGLAID